MKLRKLLSMLLCLSFVLACLPAAGIPVLAEETAPATVRIEAENAVWNRYAKVSDAAFSGGGKLGNANGTYYAWDVICNGHFNKNDWVYVAYYVDAPEAGTYQVSVAAEMKMNEACTPYAAILVNPLSGADTVSYKLPYNGEIAANTTTYMTSQKVDVQLLKGRNVIYMTPFTNDQPRNWANTDYIEITGAQAVTAIAPQQVTLPANVGYYYKVGVASETSLAYGDYAAINNEGIHAENVTRDFLKKITHTSITVEAPADGYYDLSITIAGGSGNGSGNFALALFVDDAVTAEAKPYIWNNELVDVSTYLTKGVHTLTITTSMPKNQAAADAVNVDWTDLKGLTLSGGLKLAEYQNCPLHEGTVLEVERDGYVWRYPDAAKDANSHVVGGAQPGATKQTYDQLAGGAKLNKNQPMITYYVDVETTGTYTLNASFLGNTGDNYGDNYYMIVSVDDQDYYKAGMNGTDPVYTNRWRVSTPLELTAGRHFIRLITLPGDTTASWINPDYAEIAGPGRVKAMKDQLHLSATEAHFMQGFESTGVDHSGNGAQWANAIGYYKGNSWASNAGVTTENFTFDKLSHLGWFSYTVSVPADGYYDLQTYLRPNTSTSGTGKVLLVIDQTFRWVDVILDSGASKWWIADLTSYLTEGDHVILVSGLMDYTGDSNDWCDMGALTVSGGITKSSNPVNPLHQGECVLEAETDGIIWRYTTTDQGQVGGSKPAADTYNQSYDYLISEGAVFEKRHQPSVSFVVDVTTTGTYDLIASYQGYTEESYYMVIAIDDETFVKTAYVGVDDTNSSFLLTKASVELTEGRHVIRLLPMTKGTGASWINVNYLKVEGAVDVEKVAPQQTHLSAFDAPYKMNFAGTSAADLSADAGNKDGKATWWANGVGGYHGNSVAAKAGVTTANFTLQDLASLGWISYTLNVPVDGYYDLQTYIRCNPETSGTGKMLVLIDGDYEWIDVDFGKFPFEWDMVDLSRYLTEGDHVILVSGIMEYTGGSYDWCDMGCLTVSGGITVSETQIDPLARYVHAFGVFNAEGFVNAYAELSQALEACGENQYIKLSKSAEVNMTLTKDLYIDTNGFSLTGTIDAAGFKVYGMNSTTDGYENTTGKFDCGVVPEAHFKTQITGEVRRYMAVERADGGYSFYRFYLAVNKASLRPANTGVGYRSVYYGSEAVLNNIEYVGYVLQLGENQPLTRTMAPEGFTAGLEGNTLTLRISDYDIANHGQTLLSAKAVIVLKDGTVIESSECKLSLKDMAEMINANIDDFSETQILAVQDMLTGYDLDWAISDIMNYGADASALYYRNALNMGAGRSPDPFCA